MIVFENIKIKNFFSVGNNPIEIDLNKTRKTLVVGKNGASKSSCILDSIVFALYGKPFRKVNKPSIINSINKSNMLIELNFTISKNKYKIRRGMKPSIFEIYCNNKLINQDAKSKDYQEFLEKNILKVNYKSFINVVILGSARYTPFMQMSSSDRRIIIEELLDIQIFSSMNSLLKDKVTNTKDRLNEAKFSLEIIKEKINLQKNNIKEKKQNRKEQITKNLEEIQFQKSEVEKLINETSLINRHIDNLVLKIQDKSSIEQKRNTLLSIENKLENNISKINKEEQFYNSNDSCPNCKQSIDKTFRDKQISDGIQKKEKILQGLEELTEKVKNFEDRLIQIKLIQEDISNHNAEIIKTRAKIEGIQKYIQKLEKETEELYSSNAKIETKDSTLKGLLSDLKDLENNNKILLEDKLYLDYCSLLLKDGGIKTRIIKQYLPKLNKLINVYLSHLNFFVQFEITENFEEIIKSRYRDEFSYENFSEGEKLRIDLAILFAFRQIAKLKNSVNTNLFIMDEILDSSLDLEGSDQFFDLVDSLDSKTNIIVISHRGNQIQEKFDRTLKFEKKKNFTKMTEIINE